MKPVIAGVVNKMRHASCLNNELWKSKEACGFNMLLPGARDSWQNTARCFGVRTFLRWSSSEIKGISTMWHFSGVVLWGNQNKMSHSHGFRHPTIEAKKPGQGHSSLLLRQGNVKVLLILLRSVRRPVPPFGGSWRVVPGTSW